MEPNGTLDASSQRELHRRRYPGGVGLARRAAIGKGNERSMGNIAARAARHGMRQVGKLVSRVGGYVVVPIDHRAVISDPPNDFVYSFSRRAIEADEPLYRTLITHMQPHFDAAAAQIKDDPDDDVAPYWNNAYFVANDARIAWALTAMARPRLIVEIGSGNSTRFFRHSAAVNSTGSRIVCIDPEPRAEVSRIADTVHYQPVQRVDLGVFDELRPGDVLFFDGSHLVMQGSDTQYVFLEILPRLANGVLVHVHDVSLPYEYKAFYDGRMYGEQYLLAAVLTYSPKWRTVLPVYWLERAGILDAPECAGASFWMTNDRDALLARIGA